MDGDAILVASARVRQAFEVNHALWTAIEQAREHSKSLQSQYDKTHHELEMARHELDKLVCGVDYI